MTYAYSYLRWKRGRDRRGTELPPLDPDHPHAGHVCPVCLDPLANREPIRLVAYGPDPNDPLGKTHHAEHRVYYARAIVHHSTCADTLNLETDP